MTIVSFNLPDLNAEYRPPLLSIHAAVATGTGGDGIAWSGDLYQPHLTPRQMRWASNGALSLLTMKYQGTGPAAEHPEQVACLANGDRVILREASGPQGGREWFRGCVAHQEMLIQTQDDVESLHFTAYGPQILLQAKAVSGQWHKAAYADDLEMAGTLRAIDAIRENTFASHLRVVFNESGRPNASRSAWKLTDKDASNGGYGGYGDEGGRGARVFEAPGRKVTDSDGKTLLQAEYWTAATALRSVVEYFDNYQTVSWKHTNWPAVEAVLGDTPIGEVNVEGLNLLEAMKAILLPVGFGFALTPWAESDDDGQARHALLVFALHKSADDQAGVLRPRMAPVNAGRIGMGDAAARQVEVQRLHFIRDTHRVANDVTVYGDQKRVQVSLEFTGDPDSRDLHPFWDATREENDLATYADAYGNVGGGGWRDAAAEVQFAGLFDAWSQDNYHVFRSFAWNEDGALSGVIRDEEGLPILPDLSAFGMGEDSTFIRRPRPVGPTFTCTSPAAPAQVYPARVELGIEGDDDAWIRIPCARIWPERAAVTIDHPRLGLWRPYHNAAQTLKTLYGRHTYLTLLGNALRQDGTRLRLRLVGSIECDAALVGRAERPACSSWPLRAARVVRAADRFKWRAVQDSPLGSAALDTTDGSAAEAIADYARRIRDAADDGLGHGSILLRCIADPRRCRPGLGVPATSGREISLEVSHGTETTYAPILVGVCWNFAEGVNKTELLLDSPLLQVTQ